MYRLCTPGIGVNREFLHALHFSSFLSGRGLSHLMVSVENSLRRALPSILTGAVNPSGLYKLFIVDNTPLRVKSFSSLETSKVNSSVLMSQLIPKLLCIGGESALWLRSFRSFAKFSLGNTFITLMSFDAILCNFKLDTANVC